MCAATLRPASWTVSQIAQLRGAQLLPLGRTRVKRRGEATVNRDLDEVGAPLELLTHRRARRVRRVNERGVVVHGVAGGQPEAIEVPAGGAKRQSTGDNVRSGDQTALHRVAYGDIDITACDHIAHGGEARLQIVIGVDITLQRQQARGILEVVGVPDQELSIGEQNAQELDEHTVHKDIPSPRLLEVVPHRQKCLPHWFDFDFTRHGFPTAVFADAAGCLATYHLVQRAAPLVAPHDAVDGVAAALVLDQALPPMPVLWVVGARL